jgi:hypothetical protein
MAKNQKEVEVKEFPKTFVNKDGEHQLLARDELQAAAFVKAGLKEKE